MHTIFRYIHFLFFLLLISPIFSQQIVLDTVRIAENLDGPWDIEWAGDSSLFVTEKAGKIKRFDLKNGQGKEIIEIPDVAVETQVGLMGMDFHPNFPDSSFVYAAYTFYDNDFQIWMRLIRLTYDSILDTLMVDATMYDSIPGASSGMGGRVLVSNNRKIYVSVGELELQSFAQDTISLNGKILRFNLDGSIPMDNPFPENPVWTMGHRNPQGLTEGVNGNIYSSEHGTFSDDELNLLEPSRNYGWPLATGFCDATNQMICDDLNMMEPLATWTPNIAPGGIAYYGGTTIPEWENSMLISNLVNQAITWVKLNNDGTEAVEEFTYLTNVIGRIRDITISPDGRVFIITSNTDLFGSPANDDDQIYELVRTGAASLEEEIKLPYSFSHSNENDQLLISIEAGITSVSMTAYSINGAQIISDKKLAGGQLNTINFNPGLPGIYLIRLNIEGKFYTEKIINY